MKENFVSGYFWLEFERNYCHFQNQFHAKMNKKTLHLGQIMLSLGIFRLKFEKAIVIFEIKALELVQRLKQNKTP